MKPATVTPPAPLSWLCILLSLPMMMTAFAADSPADRPFGDKVTNGLRTQSVTIPASDSHKTLIIPKDATVTKAEGEAITVEVTKRLSFKGHPPRPIHIETVQDYMGLAGKRTGKVLHLATYGEWGSMEGGASVSVSIAVPEGVTIKRRAAYAGEKSVAATPSDFSNEGNYWYTGREPAEGWAEISELAPVD